MAGDKARMSTAFLGIDIGGTGAKAGVFDEKGALLGAAHRSYHPTTGTDGRVEIVKALVRDLCRNFSGNTARCGGFIDDK